MANKKKKTINVVYESPEAARTPDSPEHRYISKVLAIADNSPVVRLIEFLIDSRGGRVYEFEVDEGYVGSWEKAKYAVMVEVGYNV